MKKEENKNMSLEEETKKLQESIGKFVEMMEPYKNVIPDDLEKRFKAAVREGKVEESSKTANEIANIVRNYVDKITSAPGSLSDEQVLWLHEETKGIFKKEKVRTWAITNLRAYVYDHTNQKQHIAGIAITDTVVMNTYRKSSGSRIGTFTGAGGRIFAGVGVSSSESQSQTYGDLVFLFKGGEILRFPGISDPHGVKKLVDTLKKQQKV